jgi:hypothetical protein
MKNKMDSLIPFYLDPRIIDISRLTIYFGSLRKSFNNYEEKDNWIKKAKKLGWDGN